MTDPIRTATDAAYEAAKELGKAGHLASVPHHRTACLDKAEDELRLALKLIEQAREPKAATAMDPVFAGIFRSMGIAA